MSYAAALDRASDLRDRLGIEPQVRRIDARGFDAVMQTARSGFVQGQQRITVQAAPAAGAQYGPGVAAARAGAPTAGVAASPTPGLRSLVDGAAARHGVPRELVAAVVRAESGGRADAVSPAGAVGLMQLMPATAAGLGVRDSLDPAQNVEGGTKYLRQMLDRYDGDVRMALAGYNAGPGNVDKYGGIPPFTETQNYVARVLRYAAEAGFRP